jgi:hypothetical protein
LSDRNREREVALLMMNYGNVRIGYPMNSFDSSDYESMMCPNSVALDAVLFVMMSA